MRRLALVLVLLAPIITGASACREICDEYNTERAKIVTLQAQIEALLRVCADRCEDLRGEYERLAIALAALDALCAHGDEAALAALPKDMDSPRDIRRAVRRAERVVKNAER